MLMKYRLVVEEHLLQEQRLVDLWLSPEHGVVSECMVQQWFPLWHVGPGRREQEVERPWQVPVSEEHSIISKCGERSGSGQGTTHLVCDDKSVRLTHDDT
jgi:hypothetical protein